jgi:hypothetical protein
MTLPNVLKIASNQHMYFFHFLAITELPCDTDGFAGSYGDYPSTPCNQGSKRCFQKVCMNTFVKTINMWYKYLVGVKFDPNLSSRHVWEGS